MTPEERNRTIEFIIQSQARLAAAQEQDREQRVEFEKWAGNLNQRLAKLIEIQTGILNRHEEHLQQYREETLELRRQAWNRDEELRKRDEDSRKRDEGSRIRDEEFRKRDEESRQRDEESRREFREFMKQSRQWQQDFLKDTQKKHEEVVAWLARILEKISDRLN